MLTADANSNSADSARKHDLKRAATLMLQMLETPKLVPYKYAKAILFDLRNLVFAVSTHKMFLFFF